MNIGNIVYCLIGNIVYYVFTGREAVFIHQPAKTKNIKHEHIKRRSTSNTQTTECVCVCVCARVCFTSLSTIFHSYDDGCCLLHETRYRF